MTFHKKTNQAYAEYFLLKFLNPFPPQVYHDITCYHNCRGDEGEEAEQEENWGGVCCNGKCWRVGEDHTGGKNQEDEERVGGMCT